MIRFSLLIFLALPVAGLAREPDSIPVWWSPDLKLASLEGISKRLNAPFQDGLPAELYLQSGKDSAEAKAMNLPVHATMGSCAGYFDLRAKHYWVPGPDAALMAERGASCQVLRMLKMARPARKTFLGPLSTIAGLPSLIPAIVLNPKDSGLKGKTLAQEEEIVRVGRGKFGTIKIYTAHSIREVAILARADFDGDGYEDVLMESVTYGIGPDDGAGSEINLCLLGRKKAAGPMYLIREFDL